MGLIKSKEEKAMEFKMYMRKKKREMEKTIKGLDTSRADIIKRAQKAKAEGLDQQYKILCNSLKFTITQRARAEEMLLQLENSIRTRDIAAMQTNLSQAMTAISKDTIKQSKDLNFDKLQKTFNTSLMQFDMDVQRIDAFLENASESFDDMAEDNEYVTDSEIEGIMNGSFDQINQQLNADIDAKINSIDKIVKDE